MQPILKKKKNTDISASVLVRTWDNAGRTKPRLQSSEVYLR